MSAASDSPHKTPPNPRWLNGLLAATTLLSAWLLFQIQPMVAKRLLPWFGGGTAIWTTAMLFFQTALLGGYLYAHLVARRLVPRQQAILHAAVLVAAATIVFTVGVVPSERWIPASNAQPAWRILVTLAACVGLPYLALAATAPLVQVWFARANPGAAPYRLYALSNFGSLAALLSYPLAVEPNLGLAAQGLVWSALFAAFAAMCLTSGFLAAKASPVTDAPIEIPAASTADSPTSSPAESHVESPAESPAANYRPPALKTFFWLALPACASVMLLAVTSHVCQDVASIPLLWIAPMVIYLASFILTFESDRWYVRWFWMPLLGASSFAAVTTWHLGPRVPWQWQAAAHMTLLLAIAMVCHGELARMRPAASRLTAFYLSIAGGGALGGFLVGVVAPLAFIDHYELPLGVLAAWMLGLAVLVTDRTSRFFDGRAFVPLLSIVVLLVALAIVMWAEISLIRVHAIAMSRNFYGVLKVRDLGTEVPAAAYRKLNNGDISHGVQHLAQVNHRVPTQYYHPATGVGQLLAVPPIAQLRVGVVGLGVGTLAAYAQEGDEFTFYEINPQVIDFADKYFTFLADARDRKATIDIVEGDARLSLEREAPHDYHVLVLDAFTSDAIPAHLLTLEAFAIYLQHLRDDGVLAVHISNRFIDLAPVVQAAAEHYGLEARWIDAPPDGSPGGSYSTWTVLARPAARLAERTGGVPIDEATKSAAPVIWTDDYNNIVEILKTE